MLYEMIDESLNLIKDYVKTIESDMEEIGVLEEDIVELAKRKFEAGSDYYGEDYLRQRLDIQSVISKVNSEFIKKTLSSMKDISELFDVDSLELSIITSAIVEVLKEYKKDLESNPDFSRITPESLKKKTKAIFEGKSIRDAVMEDETKVEK